MVHYLKITAALLVLLVCSAMFRPEEGMYPLSEIHKLNLKEAGLLIDPVEVYNPEGVSLIDALVNVGGCTGAFISDSGLIITNHHCSFGAVQAASTVENDYVTHGFLARNRTQEIQASGMFCKITQSYEDVSDKVLSSVKNISDFAERKRKTESRIKEIIAEAEINDSTLKYEVSEMFQGKTYVLFKYKVYPDVRIVYVPPRSIGEFGGETDNWVWPRHTGDFSFLRAYMAPDGSPAEYSPDNIPVNPKKYLKVNPSGVEEGDFVFILGYPGRTFRHKPSQFIEYQQNFQLPYISELYDFQIETMEELGKNDPGLALKYAARIKSLANVTKNYKGKMLGLRRMSLISNKKAQEKELQQFILLSPELQNQYGDLFIETEKVYKEAFRTAKRDLWFGQIYRSSGLLRIANSLLEHSIEIQKPDAERKSVYKEKNLDKFYMNISEAITVIDPDLEKIFLTRMIKDALNFNQHSAVSAFNNLDVKDVTEYVEDLLDDTELTEQEYFVDLTGKSYDEIIDEDDPVIALAYKLREQNNNIEEQTRNREGELDQLSAKLYEVKRLYEKKSFIPDANSTLRLTYGYVKGYSAADATYYSPFTTLQGVIEKSYEGGDYTIPDKIKELYGRKDFGNYYNEEIKGVPVALLYNMDTTGGNSGSPVLDAYGRLVGVNFDRAYGATINDYAWSEDYSRSIGVDIRYVLWVTEKIGGAEFLLEEMGVKLVESLQ